MLSLAAPEPATGGAEPHLRPGGPGPKFLHVRGAYEHTGSFQQIPRQLS